MRPAGWPPMDMSKKTCAFFDDVKLENPRPTFLAVGGREAEAGTVALRRLGSNNQQVLNADETISMLRDESLAPDMQSR